MANALDQLATLQASNCEAEEIHGTHRADGQRRKVLKRRARRQQRALQALAGQQNRYADKQRNYRAKRIFHSVLLRIRG